MVELTDLHEVRGEELSRHWKVTVNTASSQLEARVFLSDRERNSVPGGNVPLTRPFSEDEIREAIRLAIERRLVGGGGLDEEIAVSCFDLYRAAGEVC